MSTAKPKRPKSPKITGDDKLQVFQTEQYRTSDAHGQIEQNVAIRWGVLPPSAHAGTRFSMRLPSRTPSPGSWWRAAQYSSARGVTTARRKT